MTINLYRILVLWAGGLAFALLLIIPLTVWMRAVGALMVVCCVVCAWMLMERRAEHRRGPVRLTNNRLLPARTFRRPVVLVCGDGLKGLFGQVSGEQLTLRVTEQGCYVQVPSLEQLPAITDEILALRPDWGVQLSVMFTVSPGAHRDCAVLAGHVRTFSHQVSLARKRGIALPLLLVSYLQSLHGEDSWFSWSNGRHSVRVGGAGANVSFAEWQQHAVDSALQATRMHAGIQLNSVVAWLHDAVLPHLATRSASGAVATCAVKLVPALPCAVNENLWQQWLRSRVALTENKPDVPGMGLPFPDPLLSLLPRLRLRSPVQRASIVGLWLFAFAGFAALASSAWQNNLLLRQVSDDLRRYSSIPVPENRDQPQFALRENALAVLRQDATQLDSYYRRGEPLALGLGLYRGERIRLPLLAIIAGHQQPLNAPAPANIPAAVRLDSLSLFGTGSAELKPGATKVLINALVNIKAQPGWLIVIAGHTDVTGSAAQNLDLSRARASSVRDWMQRMGDIPDSCFAVQGFGASQPVASNDTVDGRSANRRVDIRLVPEVGACAVPIAVPGRKPSVASSDIQP